MAFAANPLALSVPDPTFESWLRDSGYLEVLDQRTSDLHRISSTAAATTAADSDSATADPPSVSVAAAVSSGFLLSVVLSYIGILLSLLTLNPFSKLTNEDFSGDTPSWTLGFFGYSGSYSFPSSRSQARMRVTENVKRYCRNYASLFILFFACSLYQIPIALVGLVSSLALWDLFAYYGHRWGLDNHPVTRECLLRLLQCATAVIIFVCNVQMALLCTIGVSYAVMMLHASFRKLTPVKQTVKGKQK
ncbi:PRA1 family protein H [Cynara cardunculus var. scolymus]|uniref:PRA1 family protein H n=1 Tax=Cynara cardunculus var. scolymus TaxID=59895 RepID=UPI000D62FB1E|nr:PRA1 family protein H [Cynara cardunculus var. scolymus]